MEQAEKDAIYERLLAINVKLDPSPAPDPTYINQTIWECHQYIGEVEAYNIKITRESSTLQQALNDVTAEYHVKLEGLITGDAIKVLPNIRDREAEANKKLKDELRRMQEYTNSLADLNNLLGAVNLKLKNLNRANSDVGKQIRVMESQIRLSVAPKGDPVMADLAREMARGASGQDSFAGATSEIDASAPVDPTAPLDIDNLLSDGADEPLAPMNLSDKPVGTDPDGYAEGLPGTPGTVGKPSNNLPLDDPAPAPDPEGNGYVPGESDLTSNRLDGMPAEDEEPYEITTAEAESSASGVIDLDKVLTEKPEGFNSQAQSPNSKLNIIQGGASDTIPNNKPDTNAATAATEQKVEPKKEPEQAKQKAGGIDLDDLLDAVFPTTNKTA